MQAHEPRVTPLASSKHNHTSVISDYELMKAKLFIIAIIESSLFCIYTERKSRTTICIPSRTLSKCYHQPNYQHWKAANQLEPGADFN